MKARTRQIGVYVLCGIGLIWAAMNYEPSRSKVADEGTLAPARPALTGAPLALPDATMVGSGSLISNAEDWRRDPFQLAGQAPTAIDVPDEVSGFSLGGVMKLASGPIAFINNQRVKVGDEIEGATVVSISDNSAVIRYQGQNLSLRIQRG